ncbi:Ig-like domain-containing protein [Porticoccus sp. W117]|uniref:beta strand repeat-containing protein n=1 Tax=Porticoccus sp. W117 TaxID=3054777 RepID=UPI00259150AF|nr:Ig-like domain-containing protein [Porticoccus sp. W117]MDM3872663.1 Ig-like domain-containing protein [Porticoccus sp. W117]
MDGVITGYSLASGVGAGNGNLVFNLDGSYTFDPGSDFDDLAVGESRDVTFNYTALDNAGGESSEATVTITVTGTNDAPIASNANSGTAENAALSGSVPTASDVDGTIASYDLRTDVGEGSLVFNPDGTFTFDPGSDFDDLAPDATRDVTFTYVAIDNNGAESNEASITITVTGTNDAPVASDDTSTTSENTVLNDNVPVATDVDGVITGYSLASGVGAGNGNLVFNLDGSYTFDPGSDFDDLAVGESRDVTFNYTALDNAGGESSEATATITVTGTNDSATITVTAADTAVTEDDAGNNTASGTVTVADIDNGEGTLASSTATYGTVTVDGSGNWTYTLNNGNATVQALAAGETLTDTITFTSDDGTTQTQDITITGANDVPVANNDTFTISEDTTTSALDFLSGDTDADGDSLTLESIAGVDLTPGTAQSIAVTNGTVNVSAAGEVTFTPANNYSGPISFDYEVSDGNGGTDTGTVNGTVTAVADAPTITFNSDVMTGGGSVNEIPPPASTGLTVRFYDNLNNGDRTGANIEGQNDPATVTSQTREINGFGTPKIQTSGAVQTDGSTVAVGTGDAFSVTGLIYLEAGSTYQFTGYRDDSIRIELGGETLLSTTGDSFGNYGGDTPPPGGVGFHIEGGTFTAPASGYYTIEAYVKNVSGPGQFSLNLSVDDGAPQPLNASNFNIYGSVAELTAAGGQFSTFVSNGAAGQNSDGGYFPQAINTGAQDSFIEISNISTALTDTDGSEVIDSVEISNIPVGAQLTDNAGNSFTASAGSTSVDVQSWDLNNIQILPPSGFTGDITLTVTATSRETSNNDTASTSDDITVTVVSSGAITSGVDSDLVGDVPVIEGTSGDDTLSTPLVTARVDTPSTFIPQGGVGAFQFDFSSGPSSLSIVSIAINLAAGGDANAQFDSAGGGSLAPNVVTDVGGDGGTINVVDNSAQLTATFTPGDFTVGDSFSFDIDTDQVGGDGADDGGDFGQANVTFTITYSDGSTQTGTYVEIAGNDGDLSQGVSASASDPVILVGQSGNDTLAGGAGEDALFGGEGNDILNGNAGSDALQGGVGNDILTGGAGDDILAGGLGSDTFRWVDGDEGTGAAPANDIISDFNQGQGDVLNLQDLLQGEESGDLTNYLSFSLDDGNTRIEVSSEGNGTVDQVIILDDVDLTAGGTLADAAIITNLINNNNLIVD